MIDTESAQLVEACKRRHANQSLRRKPVPELVHLVDLFVLEGSADRSAAESLTTVVFSLPTTTTGCPTVSVMVWTANILAISHCMTESF